MRVVRDHFDLFHLVTSVLIFELCKRELRLDVTDKILSIIPWTFPKIRGRRNEIYLKKKKVDEKEEKREEKCSFDRFITFGSVKAL